MSLLEDLWFDNLVVNDGEIRKGSEAERVLAASVKCDEALRETANLLREASPDDSIAFRFAGDEFILLLTTNREEAIREVEADIKKAVEAFNRSSGQTYEISLSMGHAVFETKDKDAFMEAIDSAMYIEKQAKHTSGILKDRRRSNTR